MNFRLLFLWIILGSAVSTFAQKPLVFDVSNVTIGAQRINTLYLYAAGKWSDAGEQAGSLSTEIHCYKGIGFCEVANALVSSGMSVAYLDTFDILRWDSREIIAVDSSPICMVNTLRVDFVSKIITLRSSDKGVTEDPQCKGSDKISTAVLWGEKEISREFLDRAKARAKAK